jgi:hypothetical protein
MTFASKRDKPRGQPCDRNSVEIWRNSVVAGPAGDAARAFLVGGSLVPGLAELELLCARRHRLDP